MEGTCPLFLISASGQLGFYHKVGRVATFIFCVPGLLLPLEHLVLSPALGLDSAASGSSLWERPYPHTCVPRSLSEDLLLE